MNSIIDTYILSNYDINALGHLIENMNKYESFNAFLNDPIYDNDDLSMLTRASIYGTLFGNSDKLTYLSAEDIVYIKYQYRHYYSDKCPFEYRGFVIDKLNILDSNLEKINFLKDELISLKLEKLKGGDGSNWNKSTEDNLFIETISVEFYEKCINLITLLIENQMNIPIENENAVSIPINIEYQERFVYCHKFGIINYLIDHIKSDGSKYTDVKLYKYLALITNISESTIKRLMAFTKTEVNSDTNNPFTKIDLMERVQKNITNHSMVTKR